MDLDRCYKRCHNRICSPLLIIRFAQFHTTHLSPIRAVSLVLLLSLGLSGLLAWHTVGRGVSVPSRGNIYYILYCLRTKR